VTATGPLIDENQIEVEIAAPTFKMNLNMHQAKQRLKRVRMEARQKVWLRTQRMGAGRHIGLAKPGLLMEGTAPIDVAE
jgi:hypothetical protein